MGPAVLEGEVIETLNVVLVEDEDADAELILAELASAGLVTKVVRARNEREVRGALLGGHEIDAVLCDYSLPDFDALRTLQLMKDAGVAAPLIVVSGGLSDERATECMRDGAADYILKDRLNRLPHALTQVVQHARSEMAGREVERSYRRLFENLPVAVYRATGDGRILHANPAMVAMFGFADLESLLATSLIDLHVDPNDRRTLQEQLATDGHVLDFVCRMRRVDGSQFWFSRAVNALREEGGQVVEMETIGRDVTHFIEAARKLKESEAYLSTVIETAPDAVVRMDEAGVITDWNSAAESTFGWLRSEAIGRRLSETIIPVEFRARHEAGLTNFQEGGESKVIGRRWDTFEGLRKDGQVFPIELAISQPIPLGEGKQFVSFIRDISERKRSEQDLAQSEQVFRALFEQSEVGISLFDLPTDAGPGPVRWNTRMRELLGVEGTPDSSDLSWVSQATGGQEESTIEEYMRLMSGELSTLRERRMLSRPDGTTVWADLSTVLVRDGDGTPLRFQIMALDISEQVEAEQRLARRVAQQTILVALSRAGLEGGDTSDFLATAVELLTRGTETQFGTILQLQPSGTHLERVAGYGASQLIPPDLTSPDAAAIGVDAFKSMLRTVITVDFISHPEMMRSPWMVDCGVQASMAVGIYGSISPFGVLSVHSTAARDFSTDDVQFMQLASTIISVAVERKHGERQRRMLLGRLVTAQEAERKTIAEDIHDDAVQVMTAANMRLELFRMALTDQAQIAAAEKLQETVSLATGRLRDLLFQLSPPNLQRYGLAKAMRRHLEQFETDTAVSCNLDARLDVEPSQQVQILLFRIFQEALINVRKHAQATTVTVTLTTADGGVLMHLADDGAGFNEVGADPLAGHLGLTSMRERAEIAGGWWRVKTEPGKGTEVTTWVPAPRDEEAPAATAPELIAIG